MKKLVSFLVALVAVVSFAIPAEAAGAITADEQRILTELDQGVTVGGKTFHISGSDRTQAENYLKQNDLTAAQVSTVVSNIQASRSLVAAQNVNVANINSLTDLIKALPTSVVDQLKNNIVSAASALGLTATFGPNGVTIVSSGGSGSGSTSGSGSSGSKGGSTVYQSGKAVKQTGANYIASFAVFSSLLVIAAGAFMVGRKQRLA